MQPVQIKKPQTFSYSKESAIQYGIYDFYHHKKNHHAMRSAQNKNAIARGVWRGSSELTVMIAGIK